MTVAQLILTFLAMIVSAVFILLYFGQAKPPNKPNKPEGGSR
jgi:hypothetical protein